MTQPRRDDDSALVEDAENPPTPSQQGSSGGDMAREVGVRDEAKSARGGDPLPTSVDKRDQPDDGDLPNPRQTRQ
jgi:hypothetical protein